MAANVGARQVAELPPANKRRAVRHHRNEMDRCTVISIFPKDIEEVKHTIEPGIFRIPAGTYENPGCLTVGTSSWWRDIDVEQPLLEIPVSSVQIAESIVNDFANAQVGCDMNQSMPGLFWVMGIVKSDEVAKQFKTKLDETKVKQDNWYNLLVNMGAALWARTNGNPLVVSDEMRIAARALGRDMPWLKDFQMQELEKCVACGGLRNPSYPVCPSCKFIDPTHPMAKEMRFAV